MACRYRTKGLVLKEEDKGEADRFFTLYTKDFGKIRVLGKAIRKIKSKLRGGIRFFSFSEIEFVRGKVYNTLTEAVVIKRFENIKANLGKIATAYQIVNLVDRLIKGEEKDENIWSLLEEVFENLDIENLDIDSSLEFDNQFFDLSVLRPKRMEIYYCFLWNLLSILGYRINLYRCSFCRKKIENRKRYYNQEEGVICGECFSKIGKGNEISFEAVKVLHIFLKRDWQTVLKLKISKNCEKSLNLISRNLESLASQ